VAFAAHGLDHAERSQRVDEGGRALLRRGPFRQHYALGRLSDAILGVHAQSTRRERPPDHRLHVSAGLDHDARAFVADQHRLIQPVCHPRHPRPWNGYRRGGPISGPARSNGRQVGGAQQQSEIRRIDRRRFDANDHLIRCQFGRRHVFEPQFELSARRDFRPQLEPRYVRYVCHGFTFRSMCR
jgi:hypothetical protein